jgi:hypothetical protein
MHWADANNFDFRAALDRARIHYDAEINEEVEPSSSSTRTELDPGLIATLKRNCSWCPLGFEYPLHQGSPLAEAGIQCSRRRVGKVSMDHD